MGQITCENLTFRYPGRAENALDGIQLQMGRGICAAVRQKSGCGKTTLLRQLKPAVTPGSRSGRVTLDRDAGGAAQFPGSEYPDRLRDAGPGQPDCHGSGVA